ncbi:hypothetical protein SAMN02745227_01429 [Anaerobranca californiensis DSM 14826]|uniref:Uncharacterized protein n=1 Tax=Anaerobranca californiensis DSM 14826 TaxID=1120989 RepID=A0A1M6PET8_9FIRM|nr:hypothetical protein [Anaerobranca californiensis]SHK06412.1 hypothetical protein SAMN02745227_01429 [Anaerobranca californiensis DSM 14826]
MSYVIIKGVNQLDVEGKEIDNKIYLPLEALWEDYSILREQKVVFLDSPIAGIKIGVLDTSKQKTDIIRDLKELLSGAGCTVFEVNKDYIPPETNLVLELNNDEGIYKTGYEGFNLNGSRRLAADISWSILRIFQLDYIVPPKKIKGLKEFSFWRKLTVPWIAISWRIGKDSEKLLAIAILLGLFRFTSGKIPLISDDIFITSQPVTSNIPITTSTIATETIPNKTSDNTQLLRTAIPDNKRKKEELELKEREKSNQGKLVTNPSPKLQAYMKKIIAEQNSKQKNIQDSYTITPKDIYKKSGLSKG